MAGKMKKTLSRRAQERLNHQLRAFDLAMLGIGITTAAAGLVCAFGTTSLDRPGAAGFAYWYIVVQSCLPMGLLNGMRALFGTSAFSAAIDGAGFLTATVLVWDFLLWAVLRFFGKRNGKSSFLQIFTRFALILLCWGCFQLLCAAVVAGWNHGGPASMHRKLADPQPQVRPLDGKNVKTPARPPLPH